MIVREARPEDMETIVDFQVNMALETENIALDPDTVHLGVKAVFTDPAKGKYYIAEKAGKVIASLLTTFEWSDWRNGTVIWLQSVYVMPGHRGQGVYKGMYRHIQEKVERNNRLKGIRLYAEKTNVTARKVYENLGMTSEHYLLYEWLKD